MDIQVTVRVVSEGAQEINLSEIISLLAILHVLATLLTT